MSVAYSPEWFLEEAKERIRKYAYKSGELEVKMDNAETFTFGMYNSPDFRSEDVRIPVAQLPHSCDEWVIGGPENIRALIADLTAALEKLDAAPEWKS